MPHGSWRNLLAPSVIAVAIAAGVVGPAVAAPDRPVRSMPSMRVRPAAALASAAATDCPPGRPEGVNRPEGLKTWFRLDPVVDAAGSLAGQRLAAGPIGAAPVALIDLAAESFASGPIEGLVLVGTDDGRRSRVRLIDAGRGCVVAGFETVDLVRRAVLDPDRDAVIEFRLDRRSREDLGIWRRPLGGGEGQRLAGSLPANERLGLIFSTELAWSVERDRLVVTSCGEAACLVRVIDPADGSVVTIDDPAVGEPIGLIGTSLVAYGGCPALPCSIVNHDLATGRTRLLATRAGLAAVAATPDGPATVFENVATRAGMTVARLDGSLTATIPLVDGLRLVPGAHRAAGAVDSSGGLLPFGPDGRPDVTGIGTRFLRLSDRRMLAAWEANP